MPPRPPPQDAKDSAPSKGERCRAARRSRDGNLSEASGESTTRFALTEMREHVAAALHVVEELGVAANLAKNDRRREAKKQRVERDATAMRAAPNELQVGSLQTADTTRARLNLAQIVSWRLANYVPMKRERRLAAFARVAF